MDCATEEPEMAVPTLEEAVVAVPTIEEAVVTDDARDPPAVTDEPQQQAAVPVVAPIEVRRPKTKASPGKGKGSTFLLPTASSSVKARAVGSSSCVIGVAASASVPNVAEMHVHQAAVKRPSTATPGPRSLTVPFSPKFRVDMRAHSRPVPLTTEEREAAKVAEERAQVLNRMLKNRVRMDKVKVLAANAKELMQQHHSKKELTVPTTPKFLLPKRKPKVVARAADVAPALKPPAPREDGPKKPTLFEPFQFATEARANSHAAGALKSSSAPIIPAAEIAANFLRDARQYDAPRPGVCKTITQPQAPSFSRLQSNRPKPASSQELEEAAMAEARKHAFKAKPVDRRVFESMGEMGVPKVVSKANTAFSEFHLRTEARGDKEERKQQQQHEAFKARPMPSFGQPPPPTPSTTFAPTVAVSPRFLKTRASSAPARRQKPHHTVVEQTKLQEAAQSRISSSKPPALTEPTPFRLHSSARHAESVAQFQEIIQQVEARMSEATFHAKPLPKSTFEAPQTPAPEHREPLLPLPVTLGTDARAAKRAEFNAIAAQHAKETETRKETDKRNKEEQENNEIRKLRRASIAEGGFAFIAAPVCTKDLYPTPRLASAAPTQAKSPFLLTKQRAQTSELTNALASM